MGKSEVWCDGNKIGDITGFKIGDFTDFDFSMQPNYATSPTTKPAVVKGFRDFKCDIKDFYVDKQGRQKWFHEMEDYIHRDMEIVDFFSKWKDTMGREIMTHGFRDVHASVECPRHAPYVTKPLVEITEHHQALIRDSMNGKYTRHGHVTKLKSSGPFEFYVGRGSVPSHKDHIGDLYGLIMYASGNQMLGIAGQRDHPLQAGSVYHINTNIDHWTTCDWDGLLVFAIKRYPDPRKYSYEQFAEEALAAWSTPPVRAPVRYGWDGYEPDPPRGDRLDWDKSFWTTYHSKTSHEHAFASHNIVAPIGQTTMAEFARGTTIKYVATDPVEEKPLVPFKDRLSSTTAPAPDQLKKVIADAFGKFKPETVWPMMEIQSINHLNREPAHVNIQHMNCAEKRKPN